MFLKCGCSQTYGFQHIVTIHNLETVGLLKVQGTARNYPTIRKTLKLIVEEVNEQVGNAQVLVVLHFSRIIVQQKHLVETMDCRK